MSPNAPPLDSSEIILRRLDVVVDRLEALVDRLENHDPKGDTDA